MNLVTTKYHCNDCDFEFEITYDDDKYVAPECCSYCGSSNDLKKIEQLNVEQLIEKLREYHQMNIYTVNDNWCIQLFEFDVCANDQVDCIYENSNKILIDLIKNALEWVKVDVA